MQFPQVYSAAVRKRIITQVQTQSSRGWRDAQRRHITKLYHEMARRIPAFRKFLVRHKIDPKDRQTYSTIEKALPHTTKKNYIKSNSFADLAWDGKFTTPSVFTATSGSTGAPTYFMRSHGVDQEAAIIHELFYRTSCDQKKPTLVIVCFGMGIWIGGVITYHAFQQIANEGAPISIITPGINMKEILRALENLAPNFEQVIIAGYPPFIKDVLDEAKNRRIPLRSFSLRLLFAAEPFTDRFRKYLSQKAGSLDPFLHTMNIYGTADLGANAFETPTSILIRNLATKKKQLFKDLFPETNRTPTLAQFIPTFTTFTARNGELYMSGDSAMPLINYEVGDRGGIIFFDDMEGRLKDHNIHLQKELKKNKLLSGLYKLPFVYVYERTDFSVSLYGLQVYPEPVREVLLTRPFSSFCTGKCTLATRFSSSQDQYLEINVELSGKSEPKAQDIRALRDAIVKALRSKNAEYRELSDYLKKRSRPVIVFWPNGDTQYFSRNIKQRWVA